MQVIENAVFAFRQPPSLIRHILITVGIVIVTVVMAMSTDCVALVIQLNVNIMIYSVHYMQLDVK